MRKYACAPRNRRIHTCKMFNYVRVTIYVTHVSCDLRDLFGFAGNFKLARKIYLFHLLSFRHLFDRRASERDWKVNWFDIRFRDAEKV